MDLYYWILETYKPYNVIEFQTSLSYPTLLHDPTSSPLKHHNTR